MSTVVDLFAGCGGLSLGFAAAGFDVVWGGEANELSAATYQAAFPNAEVFNGWITGPEVAEADVQIGGPPCQPFSAAGVQRGQYDPRDGIPVFIRALGASGAHTFVFEEVPDVATKFAGYFSSVLEDFRTLGFHVSHAILDAKDYGVAQTRKRLFVAGFRSGAHAGRFRWPAPQPRVTVEDAIGDLVPFFGPGPTRHSRPVLVDAPIPGARILNQGRGGIRKGGTRAKSLLYKWTMPDEQAATITVSNEVKGSEHALRILVGWQTPAAHQGGEFERRLSNVELARLQGFPDDYPWQGPPRDVARQIGNAVAPPVALAVARSVREAHG